jgi:hypothetical protein
MSQIFRQYRVAMAPQLTVVTNTIARSGAAVLVKDAHAVKVIECQGMACQRREAFPARSTVPAAAVQATFPKGNLYVDLRTEFGTLYNDQLFADLYPAERCPLEVAPWRLALVLVMQYIEGLTTVRWPMRFAAP